MTPVSRIPTEPPNVVYLESRGVAVWIKKEKATFCHKSGGSVQGTRIQITYPTGVPSA